LDEALAILYWKREEVIFTAYGIGMYENLEKGNLTLSFRGSEYYLQFFIHVSRNVYVYDFTGITLMNFIHLVRITLICSFLDTISFSDPETGDQYHFNLTTGKILHILHENDVIKFVYDSSGRLSSFNSGGKDTTVKYNDKDNIAEIRRHDNSTNNFETW
jgi:YD repeat-containing protein